jgi:predicted class III extradiol MEMO1 family dioxygenase
MEYWDTPLGKIEIDIESKWSVSAATQKLKETGKFRIIDQNDEEE